VTRALFAAALFASTIGVAAAQIGDRHIPADAARGKVEAVNASMIRIDGKTYRLAPGARFLTPKNLTVTPGMVAPGTMARYAIDERGQVRAVWLLDAGERSQGGPVRRAPASP
jgi:hypothetical protein